MDARPAYLSYGGVMEPLMKVTSHIAGKNAQVAVFPDRLEWARKGLMSTGAKAGLAVATGGLSYLATGVRGRNEGEVIPIRSISHVGRRNHRFQDYVVISTSGGDVEMRVSRREADELIGLLNKLIREAHSPMAHHPSTVEPHVSNTAGTPSLVELADLHARGALSDEEFQAAKRQILGL